ncbi:SDR family oxidoreductase [Ferrimonas sp. YFM]|uniref:UDP-glucose 4-epimerase family protein n=1 Tax=Ferrimonas sp. YFM TaxID=3028878 RepID=UPI0025722111|nr:SDR family oxidoreductase [Ferrimonas sp. YFM]BDY04080.1 UDP-glucose 4-epimerase [Ferrimonas sp. YFM]
MTVLVTGASGFVGTKLLTRLSLKDVVAFGRKRPQSLESSQYFEGEIDGESDYSSVLDGVSVIVHLAARVHVMGDSVENPLQAYRKVNTAGTINLAKQAAAAGVKRFIFISSIKVNGESTTGGKPFTERDAHAFEDHYGQSKSEAELELQKISNETGLEVVIIRPTLVYGPGVKANFASLMNLVSKGIPLPFGAINANQRSLVSVDNLVDLIVICITHPKAANQTFLVSDDHDVSTSSMVREMAKALGKSEWQVPIPVWCYIVLGKLLKKSDVVDRLTGSLQVDITHTKKTLGWTPPQTLQAGFKQTADAFLKSKECSNRL